MQRKVGKWGPGRPSFIPARTQLIHPCLYYWLGKNSHHNDNNIKDSVSETHGLVCKRALPFLRRSADIGGAEGCVGGCGGRGGGRGGGRTGGVVDDGGGGDAMRCEYDACFFLCDARCEVVRVGVGVGGNFMGNGWGWMGILGLHGRAAEGGGWIGNLWTLGYSTGNIVSLYVQTDLCEALYHTSIPFSRSQANEAFQDRQRRRTGHG